MEIAHLASEWLNKFSSMNLSSWITLGMTGKFVSEKVHEQNSSHGRWYLEVLDWETGKRHKIHYHDMRNFGTLKFLLSKSQLQSKLDTLGPDILDPTTTEEVFVEIFMAKNPSMNICKFLMNQSVSFLCLNVFSMSNLLDRIAQNIRLVD